MMGLSMSILLSRLIAISPLVSASVPSRPNAPCYVKTVSTAAGALTYIVSPGPRSSGKLKTIGFDNGIRTANPSLGSEEPTGYVTLRQLSLDGPQRQKTILPDRKRSQTCLREKPSFLH
jgi:hypothetical protein